jgi:hypothetical protein
VVWGSGPQGSFFGLVQFARCKDASVADLLEFSSDSHKWNVNFLRAAQDWEVDSLSRSSICCTPSD